MMGKVTDVLVKGGALLVRTPTIQHGRFFLSLIHIKFAMHEKLFFKY